MRRGHIDNSETYKDLLEDPLFMKVFSWLRTNRPQAREKPYDIDGKIVYAMSIVYTPEHPSQGRLEAHENYVDLQLCVGPHQERIMVADAKLLRTAEVIPEKDVTFFESPGQEVSEVLLPGEFIIFDVRTDAHMPQRMTNYGAPVPLTAPNRKILVKIRKSELQPETAAKLNQQ